MAGLDVDIVSDLNDTPPVQEGVVSANVDNVQVGREPIQQAQRVGKVDTQEAAVPAKSLRDQISSALKGEEVTPDAAQQDGGRARNPDGTFKAVEPEAPAQQVQPPVQVQQVRPAPPGIDPTVFNALPAETQAYLASTMEAVNARHNQYRGYDQIEQIIGPRRQAWALNGMTEVQAVNQLFALSDFASQDPVGFVKYFAQQSGVDLGTVDQIPAQVDPQIMELRQQVSYLNNQLHGFTNQQQQAAHREAADEVLEFFTEKDAGGNALRPYSEELGDGILPYIQVVLAQNPNWNRQQILHEAYERAIWGTPAIRAKLQQTANTAATAEQLRAAQDRTRRAQQAGASIAPGVPDSPAATQGNGSMSLRDTIRASISATQ